MDRFAALIRLISRIDRGLYSRLLAEVTNKRLKTSENEAKRPLFATELEEFILGSQNTV